MELVDTALFSLFFDFVRKKSGFDIKISPNDAAKANIKTQLDMVSIS
jgi:hypothetical protein